MGNEGAYLPSDGNGSIPEKYWKTVHEAAELAERRGLIGTDKDRNTFLESIKKLLTPQRGLPLTEVITSGELITKYLEASSKPIEFEGLHTGLETLDNLLLGVQQQNFMIICARTGVGKCHRKGTLVLMADGTTRKIEDIQIGEMVQGVDGARKVIGTHGGFGKCYKIYPRFGEPFYVSDSHIMTCVKQDAHHNGLSSGSPLENLEDILIEDLLTKDKAPDGTLTQYYLYRPPIEYPTKELSLNPYDLARWLGEKEELTYKVYNSAQELEKIKSISIPLEYLTGDRGQRLELLAGFLDARGKLVTPNIFTLDLKNATLALQIAQLSRGLGFRVLHYVMGSEEEKRQALLILGNFSVVPTRDPKKKAPNFVETENILLTQFKIEQVEDAEYCGIMVDGDQRYLLWDNTLTHNTLIANYMIANFAAQNEKILYLALEENEMEVGDRWAKIVTNNKLNVPEDRVGFLYNENISAIKEDKYNIIPLVAAASQLGYTMICVDMLNNLIDTVRDEHANAFLNRLLDEVHRTGMTLVMTARLRQPHDDHEKDFPSMDSVYGRVDLGYIVSKCIGVTALPDEMDGHTYLRLHVLKNRRKQIGMKSTYPKIKVSNLLEIFDCGDDGTATSALEEYENGGGFGKRASRNNRITNIDKMLKPPRGDAEGAETAF